MKLLGIIVGSAGASFFLGALTGLVLDPVWRGLFGSGIPNEAIITLGAAWWAALVAWIWQAEEGAEQRKREELAKAVEDRRANQEAAKSVNTERPSSPRLPNGIGRPKRRQRSRFRRRLATRERQILVTKKPQRDRSLRNRVFLPLFTRDGGRCGVCGRPVSMEMDDSHVDHIVPASRGGTDDIDNLQLAHRICNERKGDRWVPRHPDLPSLPTQLAGMGEDEPPAALI